MQVGKRIRPVNPTGYLCPKRSVGPRPFIGYLEPTGRIVEITLSVSNCSELARVIQQFDLVARRLMIELCRQPLGNGFNAQLLHHYRIDFYAIHTVRPRALDRVDGLA